MGHWHRTTLDLHRHSAYPII
jgi:hypothetical protein